MATRQQDKLDDSCIFNREVVCKGCPRECGSCGWNPAVAKCRLEKIRAEFSATDREEAAKE